MARRVRHDRASRRGTRRDSPDGPGCADGPRGSSYGQTDRTGGVDNGRAARGTTSRRAAARERLAGPLITAAGQLGVAVAQRQAAAAGVDDAKHKAQAHLRQAQLEADSMLTHAGDHVTAADDKYRQAHGDALTAGWSPAALTDMSYTPPAPPKRNRNQPAHPGTASTPLELVPAANDQTRVAQPLLRCTPRGQGLAAAARGPCKPASRQPSLARQQSCGATDHGSITSVDSADARPACGDVLGGARPSGWPGTEDELGVLRSAQLFRGLDPDDVAALLPAFAPRTLERGRQLFAQGDVDEADVFVELSGRFTVAREHRDGRAVTAVLGPGDMVGELSVFDPGPRTSTVTAVTGGRVAALTSKDLARLGDIKTARRRPAAAGAGPPAASHQQHRRRPDVRRRRRSNGQSTARARGPVRTATRPRSVGTARADPSRTRPARRRIPGDGEQDPVRVRQPRLAPARKPGRRHSRPTPARPTSPRRRLSLPARCIASRGKQLSSGLPLPTQPVPAGLLTFALRS